MIDFEALYQEQAAPVFRFALSLSGDRAQAEDITAETFVRVWTARERVDLETVSGYLITIARHLYLQGVSRDRRRGALLDEPADSSPGPERRAEGKAELDAVLTDLQSLPEPDRAAVLMRAGELMSYEQIAASLRISPGAAKVKVHRARLKLAELRVARSKR